MTTRVTIEKPISKYLEAVMDSLEREESRERVYPATYKCPKCKDKKWLLWWKDGYEYGEPCECQIKEWAEEKRRRAEEREKNAK